MGVSGVGKSTIGSRLAKQLAVEYIDGDDLHPQANIDKMASGIALTDADRRPWLDTVGRWLAEHGGVVSCSALKRAYRDRIRAQAAGAWFAQLTADRSVLRDRMARPDHFMAATLLDSQLSSLEPLGPDEYGSVYADDTIERIVAAILADLPGEVDP